MTELAYVAMRGNHPCLRYPDYDAAVKWWRETFGFRLGAEFDFDGMKLCYMHPPGDDRTTIEIGGDGRFVADPRLPLATYDDMVETFRHPGTHHYCFQVDDIETATANARERGVVILGGPVLFAPLNYWLTWWADPWGNMFEFVQP